MASNWQGEKDGYTAVDLKSAVTTMSYCRRKGKHAEISISAKGIARNQVLRHETMFSSGSQHQLYISFQPEKLSLRG
jgi:hypothetical protein